MQKIITCRVTDEYVQGTGAVVGAVGSHNDAALELSFSEIWDGTTKIVQFKDALGQNPTERILTVDLLVPGEAEVYRVPIPAEAKRVSGNMMVIIRGVVIGDDGFEEKCVATATAYYVVLESAWDEEASEEADITPSLAEQLQAEVDDIKMDISATIEAVKKLDEYVETTGKNADAAELAEQNAKNAQSAAAASATAANNSASLASTNAANAAKSAAEAKQAATDANGVLTFNGRKGAVLPQSGDYTAAQVGARPDTWMPTAADVGAAPAGYGYGEPAIDLGLVTEAELETKLTELLGTMEAKEVKQFCASKIYTSDWRWFGSLYKSSANYATCLLQSAYLGGVIIQKVYANGWKPMQWVNPPLFASKEAFLTVERIGGNTPLYKRNNNGVVEYSTDGSTNWKPYANAVGGAPSGYGIGETTGKSVDNLNDAAASGVYKFATGALNNPFPVGGGMLSVVHDGNYLMQVAYSTRDKSVKFRFRDGANFTVWFDIYTSVNVTAGTTDITAGSSALATGSYYDVYV